MTKTGYTVILGQLFKCVATDGKMELIEEKIGGQLSCKTCGLKVSKILLEGRKWWRCGECGARNYTMPRNPELEKALKQTFKKIYSGTNKQMLDNLGKKKVG